MKKTSKQVRKALIAIWGGRMPTAKQMRNRRNDARSKDKHIK